MLVDALVTTIRSLEARLLLPEVRRDRAILEQLLADDFIEIGRSGTVYDKESVISALLSEVAHADIVMTEFSLRPVSDSVVMAHYVSSRKNADLRAARRSSLWRLDKDGKWQMVFHQATAL